MAAHQPMVLFPGAWPFSFLREDAVFLWWLILTGFSLGIGGLMVLLASLAIGGRRRYPGLVPGADAMAVSGRGRNPMGGA